MRSEPAARPRGHMNQRRAYCGLLDDFAIRQKDGRPITTVDELNNHLIFSVIAGDPLVVNDGHLLMNPAVREAILHPDESPFRSLVEGGFIKILTRNGGAIELLAESMANERITSAEKLLASSYYCEQFQPALAEWSADLNKGYLDWCRPWPRHRTEQVYRKMTAPILDWLIEECGSVVSEEVDRFRDRLGDDISSRTSWEDESAKLERRSLLSPATRRLLMAAANESYQYSWGCMLADPLNPMSVQTRVAFFHGDLDLKVGELACEATTPVRLFVPNVRIARKGIRNQWDLFAQSVNPAHPVNIEKRHFLDKVNGYNTQEVTVHEVRDAAEGYSAALSRTFARDKPVHDGIDLTFGAASIATSIALIGHLGTAIGVAITVAGLTASHVPPVHALISRLGQTKPRKWIDETPSFDSEWSATFQLDLRKVELVLDGVPTFR